MLALTSLQSAAFAPAAVAARASMARPVSVSMNVETELGAVGPLGYWDPLGLAKAKPEKFQRWRAVEIKHGRIAMAATVGYIAQECFRWPGYLSTSESVKFADMPNGILAVGKIPTLGLLQIFWFIGCMEAVTWRFYDGEGPWNFKPRADKAPGDVAGDFWVRYSDPQTKATKLNIELNNGRAAMMGITGMLMHDHLVGSWIPPGF